MKPYKPACRFLAAVLSEDLATVQGCADGVPLGPTESNSRLRAGSQDEGQTTAKTETQARPSRCADGPKRGFRPELRAGVLSVPNAVFIRNRTPL